MQDIIHIQLKDKLDKLIDLIKFGLQKMCLSALCLCRGKLFHAFDAAKLKDRRPYSVCICFKKRLFSPLVMAAHLTLVSSLVLNSFLNSDGASPLIRYFS